MVSTTDCQCPAVSPYPSCEPNLDTINCKILYYLGENNTGLTGQISLPGVLSHIYTADKEDWKILGYSAIDLYKSGIFPQLSSSYWNEKYPTQIPLKRAGQCKHKYFESFTLTEKELLSCATMETWEAYGATWIEYHINEKKDYNSIPDCDKPFYILVCEALGVDVTDEYGKEAVKFVTSLIDADLSKIGAVQNHAAIINYGDDIVNNNIIFQRKEACWNWFKNIYDSYYGKKFLVSIGNESPAVGGNIHSSGRAFFRGFDFRGICVKDKNGDYPKYGIENGGNNTYYIKGNGSGQGFSISDEVSSDGGFPSKNVNSILGLENKDLDFVTTEDGKIESFVKIGYVTDSSGQTVKYSKFKDYKNSDGLWYLDFTKLNSSNYFLKNTPEGDILYIKASVDDKIYFIGPPNGGLGEDSPINTASIKIKSDEISIQTDQACPVAGDSSQCSSNSSRPNGQWALITLAEQVPLSLANQDNFSALDIMKFLYLVTQQGSTENNLKFAQKVDTFCSLIPKAAKIQGPLSSPLPFGALQNVAQLNLLQISPVSLMPKGAVIPMKSNLYSYGPYYYDGSGEKRDNTGGTEFIQYPVLAPWNFAIKDNGEYSISQGYDGMNCAGAKLAVDASKGLQQLEKGRITVAELPSYSLGHSVDDITLFPNKDGPTILTDINVDYGSNGFRTTYNFQTFTPKFGRDSKKLLDKLNQKIKENSETASYLRQERLKNSTVFRNLQQAISQTNKTSGTTGSITPIFNKKSTPHKLLISGYYLRFDDLDHSPGNTPWVSEEPYVGCGSKYDDKPFDPCKSPDPLPSPSFSPGPSKDRIYTFAETSESYQTAYIQQTYKHLHIMSADGLYLPISLRGDCAPSPSPYCSNTGRIPRFSMRTENNGKYVEWKDSQNLTVNLYNAGYPNPSKSRDEIPPFKLIGSYKPKAYSLPINQLYLNPITSSKILEDWDNRKNGTTKGFVISSIAFGDKFTDYQLTHNNLGKDQSGNPILGDDEIIRQQQDNFRFSALRGPLVLQGWGYDTAGKPIPNHADNAFHAERGKFAKCGLTDKFMKGWIENPRTWPVGPVDLRFDRERGVWTCPSPNKIVVARLKQTLKPNGKAQAELVNPVSAGIRFYENYNISGPSGENVKLRLQNAVIMVYDFIGVSISANDLIYAYYDDNRYIVLESGRAYKGTGPNSMSSEDDMYWNVACTTETTTTTTTTTPPCSWYGLDALKEVKYYNSNRQQVLGHDDKGCLIWIDTTEC